MCPKGVEMSPLSELAVTIPGLAGKTKSDFSDGNARFASYRNIFANPNLDLNSPDFVKVGETERQNSLHRGDILITGSSESLEDVGMSSVVTVEPSEPVYLNSFCFIVRPNRTDMFDPNFTKHLFRSESIRKQIRRAASGVTRINISKPRFMKIRIPVPPFEVQREIARILDQFTELEAQLEAQLEAELEARRKQYEHYRHGVFSFDDEVGVRWSTLGAISSKVSSGGTPSSGRDDFYGGDIPWVRTQEVDFGVITTTGKTITEAGLQNSSAKWISANCVIVAMYGATAAKVAINAFPVTTNQACCNLQIDPAQAEYRYVFHLVSREYQRLKALGEGSQSNLNANKVKEYPIPVPSLAEQQRIVSLLDNFDALVNDLSVGLPAELAARRKQYEHYRDRLLTFKELEV